MTGPRAHCTRRKTQAEERVSSASARTYSHIVTGCPPLETTLPAAMSQGAERYVKVIGECRSNHLKLWQLSSSHDGLAFAEGKRRSSVHTIHQESSYG